MLKKRYGDDITDEDVLSHALYPKVFEDWKDYENIYGEVRPPAPGTLPLLPLCSCTRLHRRAPPALASPLASAPWARAPAPCWWAPSLSLARAQVQE